MRSKIILILTAVAFTTIIGCASSGGWNTIKTPTDPNSLFATGTAESQDLQLAIDKAALNARTEIGRQLELYLTSMQKSFAEEVGAVGSELNQYFSQTTKEVVSTTLMGSKIRESSYKEHKGINQALVLVEYPKGAANSALVEQIKKNQNMYTRFQASEHFKELETEVEKYEKFKKQTSSFQFLFEPYFWTFYLIGSLPTEKTNTFPFGSRAAKFVRALHNSSCAAR